MTLSRGMTPPARVLAAVMLVLAIATTDLATAQLSGSDLAFGHAEARRRLLLSVALAAGSLLVLRPPLMPLARRLGAASLAIAAALVPLALAGAHTPVVYLLLRALAATVVALSFAGTLRRDELAMSLSALGAPRAFASVIDTMLRQLGAIVATGQSIALARKLRGARGPKFGAQAFGALLIASAARAERVELAMRLRSSSTPSGKAHRAESSRIRLRGHDAPWLLLALLAAVGLHTL